MAYADDKSAAQQMVAHLRTMRDQEEASTIDRIERLRRFVRDPDVLQSRERDEWEAFNRRVAPLEREIDVITGLIASVLILEGPGPIVLPKRSG